MELVPTANIEENSVKIFSKLDKYRFLLSRDSRVSIFEKSLPTTPNCKWFNRVLDLTSIPFLHAGSQLVNRKNLFPTTEVGAENPYNCFSPLHGKHGQISVQLHPGYCFTLAIGFLSLTRLLNPFWFSLTVFELIWFFDVHVKSFTQPHRLYCPRHQA